MSQLAAELRERDGGSGCGPCYREEADAPFVVHLLGPAVIAIESRWPLDGALVEAIEEFVQTMRAA